MDVVVCVRRSMWWCVVLSVSVKVCVCATCVEGKGGLLGCLSVCESV